MVRTESVEKIDPVRQFDVSQPPLLLTLPTKVRRICCIGAGYVGGPTCAVIALKCPHIDVTVVDKSTERIQQWNSDRLPLFEQGLDEIVKKCRHSPTNLSGNLHFSTDIEKTVSEADIIFVSVNTPTKCFGHGKFKGADLTYVEQAARTIADCVKRGRKIVVEKSTVPVKAAESIATILRMNRHSDARFDVLSNPEFLAEGSAIRDLLSPDRILIGGDRSDDGLRAIQFLSTVYANWVEPERILTMDVWSSELSKLASNAFLAQRISSINAMSALCEQSGADVGEVARAVGSDSRIGSQFLQASVGFGGSCFKKDILNLVYICESLNLPEVADYWASIVKMNDYQKSRFGRFIVSSLFNTVAEKRICILGFAFKCGTTDTRESPAIDVVLHLLEERARISIYDPEVRSSQMRRELLDHINQRLSSGISTLNNIHWSSVSNSNGMVGERILAELVDFYGVPDVPESVAASVDMNNNNRHAESTTEFDYMRRAYAAAYQAHALVICTEWQMFRTPRVVRTQQGFPSTQDRLNESILKRKLANGGGFGEEAFGGQANESEQLSYPKMFQSMMKPAFIFDGRRVTDHNYLKSIGYQVHVLGRSDDATLFDDNNFQN